jgi:pyridoxamine 5'-phosphate oxidase
MAEDALLRDRLRALPVFPNELPRFDTDAAPVAPLPLLVDWLELAIAAGVLQPHAMSIATVNADGRPANRTLLLKDIDDEAVWFATLSSSPKGRDLAGRPDAAVVLYWREQGRQVRISGRVEAGPREVSDRDFLQRSPGARARAIAGRQSEPVEDFAEHLKGATEIVANDPDFVPETWVAYRLIPESVEFWQAERERDQVRLRYLRAGNAWVKDILWP